MATATINDITTGTPALTDVMELQRTAAGASLKATVAAIVSTPSQTLVTPLLGTPTSGVLTNCTGLPLASVTGLGTGVATFLGTPSSANLAAAVTGETGTGALVFGTSPSLTTPTLGVATATSINKVTITAPATSATLTLIDGTTVTGPPASGTLIANPMTTVGDLIYGGTSGLPTRLAASTLNFVLTSQGAGIAPLWAAAPGGFTPPTGTGFPHITSGTLDGASVPVNLGTADVTGVLPIAVNAQTGTSYTVLSGDQGKLVTLSNSSAVAVTLPQATGSFAAGWAVTIQNKGAGTVTITPTTSNIDGASTITLTTNQGISLVSDGTNYASFRGIGSVGTVTHTAGALTANALMVGNGTADSKVLASLGTTTTVLHGNASGLPTFSAVDLANDVTGVIPTVINAQTGTTYTVLSTDQDKLVTLSNGSAVAVTMPQATGSFTAGYRTTLLNLGAGLVTITPTTSTINGAATKTLATGQSITMASDGTNYSATMGYPGFSLTTTGTSGAATLTGTVLNVPQYTGGGGSSNPSISGIELAYNSATVLRVKAGTAVVNGTNVTFSQTDYTSGSTMKNIANSTVTLAAASMYWVFLSSGGVIAIQLNNGSGDGATPVFDTTLDYWKSASTGAAWRRIGKFWTNASSQIVKFLFVGPGRYRMMQIYDIAGSPPAGLIVVSGVTGTASYVSVTITPYITADDEHYAPFVQLLPASTTTSGMNCDLSLDSGTSVSSRFGNAANQTSALGVYAAGVPYLPYSSTLHYSATVSASVYIILSGVKIYV